MSFLPQIPPMSAGNTPQRRNMLPVLGTGQWTEAAQQANWVLGIGSTLVTSGPTQFDMVADGVYEFRFKCLPRPMNRFRLWCVSFSVDEDGGGGTIRSLDGTTEYARFEVPATGQEIASHTTKIVTFVTDNADDDVDGNGHSEFGFEILVDSTVEEELRITSLGCYELPLVYVAPGDIGGMGVFPPEETLATGKPIYDKEDGPPPTVGPAAVAYGTVAAETKAKRSALAAWHLTDSVQETGATFVPAFGGNVPLLARRRYSTDGAGNRTIKVWVYAIGVGQVRLTMTSGDTATLTYNTPSDYEWQTATIDVDAESLASLGTDGGLQSATHDELLVEIRCTDTVIGLRCICAGEVD